MLNQLFFLVSSLNLPACPERFEMKLKTKLTNFSFDQSYWIWTYCCRANTKTPRYGLGGSESILVFVWIEGYAGVGDDLHDSVYCAVVFSIGFCGYDEIIVDEVCL